MLKPGVHRMKPCDHDDGQAYIFTCFVDRDDASYEQWNCKLCGHKELIKV